MNFRLLTLFVLAFSFRFLLFSSTLYVGSGQPYSTISSAHAAAITGDTIILMNDIVEYNISVTKGVTIQGDGTTRKAVDGNILGRIFSINSTSPVTLRNLNIKNGYIVDVRGAGLYVSGTTDLTIENCIIQENRSYGFSGGGGGMCLTDNVNADVSSSTFYHNNTWNPGGSISVISSGCTLTMTDTEVLNSSVNDYGGGGIYANGTVNLTGCIISNNSACRGGGGMYTTGNVTLLNCTLNGNSSTYTSYGGGGIMSTSGSLNATGTTFNGNNSSNNGGALMLQNGTYNLINCTLSGNVAYNMSGAADISASSLVLNSCTVNGNRAYAAGAFYFPANSSGTLLNTIVGDNDGYSNNSEIMTYATLSINYSLVEKTYGLYYWSGGNNIFNTDPKLLPLAENGNPNGTNTCALQSDSPVINAGTASGTPVTDQRGIARFGVPDMGSYEFTPVSAAVTTQDVTDISGTTATGNGNITDLGLPNPTQHGVCWNLTGNPTLSDSKTELGAATATGAFTSGITALTQFEKYYVKAYATNMAGTSYGNEVNFVASGEFTSKPDAVNCINLNGSNQWLQGNIATTAMNNVTMEAWVWWDGQTSGSRSIVYNGNTGGSGYGIYLYSGAVPARSLTILCGGKGWVTSSTELPTGGWHHVAAVCDVGTWKLYLDGVERTLSNSAVVPNTPAGSFNIGSGTGGGGDLFKGKIDEVRIWTTARTQAQIRASYASLAGNETGLTSYWRLDEGSGTKTMDGSAHGNTQTLYNSPTWVIPSTAPVYSPDLTSNPSSWDFGNVLIGERSQKSFTVSNSGGGILHISATAVPGGAYTVSPAAANVLSGGNQVFTLTFAPTASGAQNGNFSFTDNAGNHTVSITGSGYFQAQANAENCVYFDGGNDFIQTNVDAQPSAMAVTTWEAWFKPTRLNYAAEYQGILSTDNGGWDRGIWIAPNSSQLVIGYGANGWNPGVTLTAGVWHHIALVYKADNVLFYFNGKEYSLGIAPSGQATTFKLAIGASVNGTNQWFQGEIDEVRIWNTVRTKAEIQASYASLAGNETGLTAYWRMDEGSGLTTGDGSGHGYTGTLTNGPVWVVPSTAPVYAPAYQTNATSIDFGKVTINTTSDKYFTITNTGGGFLNIASLISDNARFTVLPASANIASGSGQQFTVTFAPITGLDQAGTLTLTHNPNAATHNITLSGKVFNGSGTSGDPYKIANLTDLRTLSETNGIWNKYFIQTADIDASATSGWNSGAGFSPIGINPTYSFTGNYNGQGYKIDNLFIYRGGTTYVALFGRTASPAEVKNITVTNANITGSAAVGVIVGENRIVSIINCGCTGAVNGAGGLVGGLTGWNNGGTVSGCYSNVSVKGQSDTGGLVGNNTAQIINSYSFGSVTRITGSTNASIGAFIGASTANVQKCYSTGSVYYEGTTNPTDKGFIGSLSGSPTGCFFDNDASNQNSGSGATSKTSVEMKTRPTFTDAGWDYKGETANGTDDIWNIGNGRNGNYPYLSWQFPSDPAPGLAVLTTTAISGISAVTAASGGNITNNNQGAVVQRGVCWSVSPTPSVSDSITSDGSGTGVFVSNLTGLSPYTDYYVRAYAINSIGTAYGNELSFRTLGIVPAVTTQAVSSIKGTTATGNGNITDLGVPDPIQYGICWNTAGNPTVGDYKTEKGSVHSTGAFTSGMTGLSCGTTYYVKAYAQNVQGTAYGDQVSFTTAALDGSGTIEEPYMITNLNDLKFVSENNSYWNKCFIQTADIDASATSGWNAGAGFSPIGNGINKFTGKYNGQGYGISGLFINRPSSDYQGLFGYTLGTLIQNLNLVSVNITGKRYTGALVGYSTGSSQVKNCSVTGSVSGINDNNVGGLVGCNSSSAVEKCFSGCSVSMTGNYFSCGGLVGWNDHGTVTDSYATGSITGVNGVGGLVGNNDSGSQINRSFSTGSVSGTGNYIGGLTGYEFTSSTGASFWDKETSGKTSSASGTGKTTAEMKTLTTFTGAGWDFTTIWNMDGYNNSGYPFLRWQVFPIYAPLNMTIVYSSINPVLSWTAVTGAVSYKVYSSSDPYAVFPSGWTLETTVTGPTWTDTNAGATAKKFYVVVAIK